MSLLAYLDAASGSMIVSAVVAGGAGIALFAKRGWWRFSALFSKSQREKLEAMEAAVTDDEATGELEEEPAETLSTDL